MLLASYMGHLGVVETLLTAGADFTVRDQTGESALDIAAIEGHVPVIQAILGHGADVNDRCDNGSTALHSAASGGAVDALVEAGADIEFKNETGQTPFLCAARIASCKGMLALQHHGGRLNVRDNDGDTALHLACFIKCEGLEAAVDLLLRWGADETALNDQGLTPAERLDVEHNGTWKRATRDEIERTRSLLSRAPADRAWRRRGWLIMLRSRAEKARAAMSCDCSGIVIDGPSATGGSRGDGGCKAARSKETRGGGGDHVVPRPGRSDVGVDGGDGDGNGGVFTGAVGLLVGLEVDGVFRTVLSFL